MSNAFSQAERYSTLSIGLVYGIRMLGLFMLLPVLTLFARDYSGATSVLLGLCIGAYGITQAFFQIPFGILSDFLGRKIVLSIGLLLFLVGCIVAAEATTIWGLIVGRLIQGAGAIAGVLMALLSDLTRDVVRTKAMMIIGMSIGASFFVAFLVGPLVADSYQLSGIFWLMSVLVMLSLLIIWFAVPNPPSQKSYKTTRQQLKVVMGNSVLWRLNVGVFLVHALMTLLFLVLPILVVKAFDWSAKELAWFYLPIMGIALIFAMPVMFSLERKGNINWVFLIAAGALFVSMIMFFETGATHMGLIVGTFVFFLGFHMLEAILPSYLSKQVTPDSRGAAMGVFSTCQFLGAFVGGSVGGIVAKLWGVSGVFLVGALLAVICYSVFWGMHRNEDVYIEKSIS